MIETLKNRSSEELISIVIDKENLLLEKGNLLLEKENLLLEQEKRIQDYQTDIENLKHQITLFQKIIFGSKKEEHKALNNPQQTQLPFEEKVDLDLPQDVEAQKTIVHRNSKNTKRTDYSKLELPTDLERVEIILEPLTKTNDMVKIDEEVTELLAISPQKFYVKKIIRPKYIKISKDETSGEEIKSFVIADLPSRPVQGGKVDVSLLVMLLMAKYVYHMPIYRIQKKLEQLGLKLSESTLGSWVAESLKLLGHLYDELVNRVKQCKYLQADETPIKVLDKAKKGTTHRGYYWVYHDVESGLVLYEYNPSRGQTAPIQFLSNYEGYLQTDGYAVYDILPNKKIKLVGCMAHARRYFYEAEENDKARATWMLDKLQQLYQIEEEARQQNLTPANRLALRQQKSVVLLTEIKTWLNENQKQVPPKSPTGKAMTYMNMRWEKLSLFAYDGILEMDNNLVENAIRPIAIGRKNYLFAGSHEAASRAGIIYSFITCCKKNNINPHRWLEDTLANLPDTTKSNLYTLLPVKNFNVM